MGPRTLEYLTKPVFVITFLYQGWQADNYNVERVNALYRMVKRNLTLDFRFAVFTDRHYDGIDDEIIVLRMKPGYLKRNRCFPRLQMFNDDILMEHARRVIMMDLDLVITDNLDEIVCKWPNEKIVFWEDALAKKSPNIYCYNGGFVMFDPRSNTNLDLEWTGEREIAKSGFAGSDQAWYRFELGEKMPRLDGSDGLYSYKFDNIRGKPLPENSKIVFFHGKPKPWEVEDEWVKEHYG